MPISRRLLYNSSPIEEFTDEAGGSVDSLGRGIQLVSERRRGGVGSTRALGGRELVDIMRSGNAAEFLAVILPFQV